MPVLKQPVIVTKKPIRILKVILNYLNKITQTFWNELKISLRMRTMKYAADWRSLKSLWIRVKHFKLMKTNRKLATKQHFFMEFFDSYVILYFKLTSVFQIKNASKVKEALLTTPLS